MNPPNRPGTPFPSAIVTGNQYFLITITNYPNLLQRTLQYQQSPNQQYETILYNTLRFELEECIRAYLQRTHRLFPISLIIDLSNI
ncbi:unnamed protein product [Rotaria sordida]|uniref:Uncharacterized protein n=1 Tax=Rotaria sordida TaxID=392033 RepID=A0A815Q4N5_9BILA|nr:unnamed protein product [Rotaria sordida]